MFAKVFIFQFFFILVSTVSPQQTSEKKQLPPPNQTRLRTIDVKHLAIDLQFDWRKKQAFGTTSITFSPLNPTDKISLDAAMMTISSISLSEKSLKFDYLGGDKNNNLQITLDRIYQSNEELTIKIDYRTNFVNEIDPTSLGGNNGKGLRFNAPSSSDPIKVREIWSFGDPESNRYWFPGYDAPNDWRTTEFTATVDKKLTVVSNGKLLQTKDNADGTRTFHYKTDQSYPNHLTSFVISEYINFRQNYDDIELNNFGYAKEKEWVAATVERLPDMVRFFSEKTGVKYPYPSYSQAFVQDIGTFSANNSVSTITENMVDDYGTHADFYYLWDLTEAEALAAQWFGNYISAADWRDVWLNKSFAQYFNGLYNEHKNGRDEFLLYQHGFNQGTYLFDWNSGNRRPIVTRNFDNLTGFVNDNYSSLRGANVLRLLQKHLGEEKWWKAIRHYVKTNGGKQVTTEDFQKAVENASGEKLDWFFDQWLYKMGHPVFEVTKSYSDGKLTLKVKQTQQIDKNNQFPQTEFFQGKIEVEIDNKIEQIWLKPQAENVFTFAAATEPKLVNFDFQSTWIKELKFDKSLDELLYQLQKSQDILARNSAMLELVNLAKSEKTSAPDKAKIQAAFRNLITSDYYWRLRFNLISQLQNFPLDEPTIEALLTVIKKDKSWTRANAVRVLGNTNNPKFADLYLSLLDDPSDRVIASAALALGKTKSPKAFAALAKLVNRPSMKSQSLLSALSGLKALGDPRGFEIAYQALSDLTLPRWRLTSFPPSWDYRPVAVDTIVALGKKEAVFPLIFERFKKSMDENDLNGVFGNILLIIILTDSRGQAAFDMLKVKYKDDTDLMKAINSYEIQFKEATKK